MSGLISCGAGAVASGSARRLPRNPPHSKEITRTFVKTELPLSLTLRLLSGGLAGAAVSITITNPTPATSDYFGYAVAAVGTDKALVGAYSDNTPSTVAGKTSATPRPGSDLERAGSKTKGPATR